LEPIVDHPRITVKDFERAVRFYDVLMPLLGFDPARRSQPRIEEHDFDVVEYVHPRLCFAITSPRASVAHEDVHRRRPGARHHLAFEASSRAEVYRVHRELVAIGATIVEPPREYPQYSPPGYYAVFFKASDGIKYEIVRANVVH
jgi:catechol 2,3-dioxygenase-like lactoylglutathione lyase family enzyme